VDIFFTFFFPIFLIAGTLILGFREIRSYLRITSSGQRSGRYFARLVRRIFGLLIMISIGIMIFIGVKIIPPASSPIGYMKFWLVCIFLVLCVLVLAIWDALCEIRAIKQFVDEFHDNELKDLRNKFKIYHN
jgi:hypothetical protein